MVEIDDVLKILIVLGLGIGAMALVAAADLPGTAGADSGEPRYVLTAEVGVESAELSNDKIRINEESFRSDVKQQGLLPPLSMTGGGAAMSFLEAENVKMDYTLQGPIDDPVTKTEHLGSVGAVSASKMSSFKASNLPCGQYVLHMDLYWNTGEDYMQREIPIHCNEGESQ